MFAVFGTTWEPSPRARQMMRDFGNAIRDGREQLKCGADALGMSPAQLSRLLNCALPSLLARVADAPEIERALILRRGPQLGLRVIDERTARLIEEQKESA